MASSQDGDGDIIAQDGVAWRWRWGHNYPRYGDGDGDGQALLLQLLMKAFEILSFCWAPGPKSSKPQVRGEGEGRGALLG